MDHCEIQPFVESTRHVFRTLMLQEADPVGEAVGGPDSAVIRASIDLCGDRAGSIELVLPVETARRINAMLTGAPGGGDSSDLCDAAAELVELIASGGVSRFLGLDIRLMPARASMRAIASAFDVRDGAITRIAFVCESGSFDLEIGLSAAPMAVAAEHGSGER